MSFDETAGHSEILCLYHSVFLAHLHIDILLLFWQDVLNQRCWFFREDESTLFRVLGIVHFAHGQFVAVACHDGEFLAREIEIDAVHDGADGIFCRCK